MSASPIAPFLSCSKDPRPPATAACVLFNRFFMRQSFAEHDRWMVATACLLAACKVEEQHRRVRDILALSVKARYPGSKTRGALPDPAGPDYAALRDKLTDMERRVLYTLEFDAAVELPYAHITAQVVRWRDAGVLGRKSDAGPAAGFLDKWAAHAAYTLATTEAGLLLTGRELAACSLFLGARFMRSHYSPGLPSGWRLGDDAFFPPGPPEGWLIRDRSLLILAERYFSATIEGGFRDDGILAEAEAAQRAGAFSAAAAGRARRLGREDVPWSPLSPPNSSPAAGGGSYGSSAAAHGGLGTSGSAGNLDPAAVAASVTTPSAAPGPASSPPGMPGASSAGASSLGGTGGFQIGTGEEGGTIASAAGGGDEPPISAEAAAKAEANRRILAQMQMLSRVDTAGGIGALGAQPLPTPSALGGGASASASLLSAMAMAMGQHR